MKKSVGTIPKRGAFAVAISSLLVSGLFTAGCVEERIAEREPVGELVEEHIGESRCRDLPDRDWSASWVTARVCELEDREHDARCYVLRTYESIAISCVRDSFDGGAGSVSSRTR